MSGDRLLPIFIHSHRDNALKRRFMMSAVGAGLLAMSLAATASENSADGNRWYLGVGVGHAKFDLNTTDDERHLPLQDAQGNFLSSDTYRFDTTSHAAIAHLGYRHNEYVGGELNYYVMGSVNRDGEFDVPSGPLTGVVSSKTRFKADGAAVSVLGYLPLNQRWDLYGRLGIHHWRMDSSFTLAWNSMVFRTGSPDDSGNDLLLGIGTQYRWGDYSLRLEYQRYTFKTPFNAENDAVGNVVGLGYSYHF